MPNALGELVLGGEAGVEHVVILAAHQPLPLLVSADPRFFDKSTGEPRPLTTTAGAVALAAPEPCMPGKSVLNLLPNGNGRLV
jgi:hypothetical protein